ncbi:hypothetical protein GCM10010156_71990 [Planobispora rosea]|uniref:Uncharacterized protein n=1 Tax=Planobispora rosea TaxID=35762 RepID=A0A8J3S9Y5_PLARO|nr:hypothetical protein GCM10010156_71990 [Planobispora rosea]GIH88765.1 hypothetical protein Pro02_71730 [Planobispora rosea]
MNHSCISAGSPSGTAFAGLDSFGCVTGCSLLTVSAPPGPPDGVLVADDTIADLVRHAGTGVTEAVYRHQLRLVIMKGAHTPG